MAKTIKDRYDDDTTAGDDETKNWLFPSDDNAGNPATLDKTQLSDAVTTVGAVKDINDRVSALETATPIPTPATVPTWSIVLQPFKLTADISVANYTVKAGAAWIIVTDSDTVPTDDAVIGVSPPTGFTSGTWPRTYSVASYDNSELVRFYQYDDVDGIVEALTTIGGASGVLLTPVLDPSITDPTQTPNAVVFNNQTDVPLSTAIQSNAVTISGLSTQPTTISAFGGRYSINGRTPFTSVAGIVSNNDNIRLELDSSPTNSTQTNMVVIIGASAFPFIVTTLAAGVTPGVLSLDQGPFSTAEDSGPITFTVNRAVGTDGPVACTVSTYYQADYHTAVPALNYTTITRQLVTLANGVASATFDVALIDSDISQDVVGEVQIDWDSATGGATIDTDNDAVLFTVAATGAVATDSWQQSATGDHIVKIPFESANNVITARSGATWVPITYKTVDGLSTGVGWARTATPGFSSVSPEVLMTINFTQTGTHYLHVQCASPYSTPDFDVSFDGTELSRFSFPSFTDWFWQEDSSTYQISVGATGIHELRIFASDEFVYITDVLLTDNATYDSPTNGSAEAASSWTAAGTPGADPDNPVIPIGPGPFVDDTTPDSWVFTAVTGATTGSTHTTATITVLGINTATPISISGGINAEYSIDGGAFTSAAGTIVNEQTFAVHADASGSASTLSAATLTIGTVSVAFNITTKSAGAVVLGNSSSSTIVVSSNNTTITDYDINVASGNGIFINQGVTGTIINNCRINAPAGYGITGNYVGTVTISNVDVESSLFRAVYFYNDSAVSVPVTGISVTNSVFENCSSGVSIWGIPGNITIEDNFIKNVQGQNEATTGNAVQLAFCRGAGISVARNNIINIIGESNCEDIISFYRCSGTPASYLTTDGNHIMGGGPSNSGSVIQMEYDAITGGNYFLAQSNILYNTSQSAFGVECNNTIVRNNNVLSEYVPARFWPNVPLAPFFTRRDKWGATETPTGITIEQNKIRWWQTPFWTGGDPVLVGAYFVDTNYFSPSDISGWNTNLIDTSGNNVSGLTSAMWNSAWEIRPSVLT